MITNIGQIQCGQRVQYVHIKNHKVEEHFTYSKLINCLKITSKTVTLLIFHFQFKQTPLLKAQSKLQSDLIYGSRKDSCTLFLLLTHSLTHLLTDSKKKSRTFSFVMYIIKASLRVFILLL